jgi:hypothetical protein
MSAASLDICSASNSMCSRISAAPRTVAHSSGVQSFDKGWVARHDRPPNPAYIDGAFARQCSHHTTQTPCLASPSQSLKLVGARAHNRRSKQAAATRCCLSQRCECTTHRFTTFARAFIQEANAKLAETSSKAHKAGIFADFI